MARASAGNAVRIVGIEAMEPEWVDKVIKQGDANKNRLGPMPYSGFREAATNGNIAVSLARVAMTRSRTWPAAVGASP